MVRKQDSAPERIQAHQQMSREQRSRVSSNRRLVSKSKPSVTAVRQNWVTSLLWMTVLLSGAGLVTGGVWLSLQLFINPDAISWVNYLLPEWAKIPLVNPDQPQTITQIRANLSKLGQIPGELLTLETNAQTLQPTSVLLPILSSQPNCQINCQQIVELRVYDLTSTGDGQKPQKGEVYYQLVTQVPVEGPEESFVIAPLLNGEISDNGSSRPLPLTQLGRFEGTTPTAGVWFYLRGQRLQGANALTYGQIVHYNPSRSYLSLMLPWTSPTGQAPQWQQVTGSGSPELVVNQTIDLEPQLRVYQVKPAEFFLNPIQLELISLAEPALNNPAYQRAILIARTGLWSPAWKWLQFIKQQRQLNRQPWSAQAQAQMDLIELYAQLTKSQAEKTWASPSQEVLADLIDGRWGKGLQVFQGSSLENTQEIATLLAADSGRVWNRVEVALRMNPERPEVKAWGALIVGAKEGRRSAIAWLKQQPKTTPATITYIQKLLKRLEGDFSTTKIPSSHPSRIVGSVQPVTKFNPTEWLQPNQKAPLKLADQQWYQVQIAAYHDGKRWRRTPFSGLRLPKTAQALSLWQQLGLDTDSQIQIIVWLPDGQQEIRLATVKAVQLRGGVLQLLAAASEKIDDAHLNLQRRPLALTQAALEWVQSDPLTLADLTQQQQPLEVTAILPALWRELQKSSPSPKKSLIPSFEQLHEQLGQWPVQLIELTGDTLPEVMLTISPETIATLNNPELGASNLSKGNQPQSRTIIFSNIGTLLYSEFSTASQQTVTAIADLKDDEPPALLVEGSKTYSLQRWSVKRHRFE
jgi:hypothetical protein